MTEVSHQRFRIAPTAVGVAVCALVLTTACHHHRRHRDTAVAVSPVVFSLDSELYHATDEDYYYWTTSLDQALVTFRVRHFDHGEARVRVYDADGFLIFDRDYCDCSDGFFHGDEYEDSAFTSIGTPGRWTIRVQYWDFDGHFYLTLD